MTAIPNDAAETPKPKPPTRREGTKQVLLIEMLKAPIGATMEEIISATGWQAHSARGAMSGVLSKKLGLIVTSAKEADRGRVSCIGEPVPCRGWLVSSADGNEPRSVCRLRR